MEAIVKKWGNGMAHRHRACAPQDIQAERIAGRHHRKEPAQARWYWRADRQGSL